MTYIKSCQPPKTGSYYVAISYKRKDGENRHKEIFVKDGEQFVLQDRTRVLFYLVEEGNG